MMSRCSLCASCAKGRPKSLERRVVEGGDGLAPCLRVIGQVLVAEPIATPLGQARVDDLEDRHAGVFVLSQEPVQQGAGGGLLLGSEELWRVRRPEAGVDHRRW